VGYALHEEWRVIKKGLLGKSQESGKTTTTTASQGPCNFSAERPTATGDEYIGFHATTLPLTSRQARNHTSKALQIPAIPDATALELSFVRSRVLTFLAMPVWRWQATRPKNVVLNIPMRSIQEDRYLGSTEPAP